MLTSSLGLTFNVHKDVFSLPVHEVWVVSEVRDGISVLGVLAQQPRNQIVLIVGQHRACLPLEVRGTLRSRIPLSVLTQSFLVRKQNL